LNPKYQELLEKKIRVYEKIINDMKTIDFELVAEFEKEFIKLQNIDEEINNDPETSIQKVLKIKL